MIMANRVIFRLAIEFKKVGFRFYLFLIIGIPLCIFLITSAFILLNAQQLAEQPTDIVVSNNLGAWSALLYPLVLLVLVQNLVDVETKGNILSYSKSYKKNWIDLFLLKAFVAILVLTLITFFNVIFNYGLVKLAAAYMKTENNQASVMTYSLRFLKLIPALTPAIFFHLMLCFTVKKSGVAYLVGMLLIIIGIPIANISNYSIVPYSFGVVVLNPKGYIGLITFIGFLVILITPLMTNLVIKK
jgi:hypothetical protein